METTSSTKTWVPYMNPEDCSQGFCSQYCPEWCYIVYPPPPPFGLTKENSTSTTNFSPLVIAIIGILASSFLLVSYYAVISKYCKNRDVTSSRRQIHVLDMELDGSRSDPSFHLQRDVSPSGLDEDLIKSIKVVKFKKDDGLVQETDCSICLSEFHDDESLRLLPICSHAFHASCIDVWLKFHSNCPLCRANIAFLNYEIIEIPPQQPNDVVLVVEQEVTEVMGVNEQENVRIFDHLTTGSETVVSVETQQVRRSVSMDNPFQGRVSIADILHSNDDIEDHHTMELQQFQPPTVSNTSSSSNRNKALNYVMSPVRMKRSFSSGRLVFPKHGRGRSPIIPL